MQQESQFIEFIIIKLTYRAFELMSVSNSKSSLLHFSDSIVLSSITFYINDFFEGFLNFKNQFRFL